MQQKNFVKFYFLFYIAILLLAFNNVYAAPSVTIISPNGGEVLNGTATIQWTASDSGNSQNLIGSIFYSNPATPINPNYFIAKNLDLKNYCDWTTAEILNTQNDDYVINYNKFAHGLSGYQGNPEIFEYMNVWRAVGTANDGIYSLDWNGSGWIPSIIDFNKGLNSAGLLPSADARNFKFFEIGSNLYSISVSAGCSMSNIFGSRWIGTEWIPDYDINKGLLPISYCEDSIGIFNLNGQWHLLDYGYNSSSVINSIKGYDWNGSGWSENNYYVSNLTELEPYGKTGSSVTVLNTYIQNGTLKLNVNWNSGAGCRPAQTLCVSAYSFFNGFWQPDYDSNFGLPIKTAFLKTVQFADSNYINFAIISDDINAYVETASALRTAETANCSYEWNTNTALNGIWYLDINATNGTLTTVDSSASTFRILNYSLSDMNVVCVDNCTVQGFDGNAIVLNPIAEGSDIKFYAKNNSVAKSFAIKVNNSLKDGKRYFAYSSLPTSVDANYSFDYSLTFGADGSHTDGIQKIYDGNLERFVYSMTEPNISSNAKKYYVLKYQSPAKQWDSIGNSASWDNALLPQIGDLNGLSMDIFQTSSYANISSQYKYEINSLTSNLKPHVLVFTAKTLQGSKTVAAGTVENKSSTPSATDSVTSVAKTYDFASSTSGWETLKSIGNSAATFQIYDYAFIKNDLFTKGISVKDSTGETLPAIIVEGRSWQYINEGSNYKVQAQVYDQQGTIKTVEIFTYLETVNDNNLASYAIYDLSSNAEAEKYWNFDYSMPALIDLTKGNKKMLVKMRVTTQAGYSEVSSQWFEFVQFPYFPADFSINSVTSNLIVGTNPKTVVTIRDIFPDTLRGVNYYIFSDLNSPDHSDYNKTYYKDTDFSCNGLNCNFTIDTKDWVVPSNGRWNIIVSALLTTETEDWNSDKTAHREILFVKYKEFETARIFEAIQRSDSAYRNDEPITLTLQLRDKDKGNLKNSIDVKMQLWSCELPTGTTSCTKQDLNFMPDQFIYDYQNGTNYWFWRTIFSDSNGELLADGRYYRFEAIVTDKLNQHSAIVNPVLTAKCLDGNYPADFDGANLKAFDLNIGCNLGGFAPRIVTTDINSYERRILINKNKDLNKPSFTSLGCLNVIKYIEKNSYVDNLSIPLECYFNLNYNEMAIDDVTFIVGNAFSDYSKTGNNKQYIEIKVPYSFILLNGDIESIKNAYQKSYGSTPTILADLVQLSLDKGKNQVEKRISGMINDGLDYAKWALKTVGQKTDFINSYYVSSYDDVNYQTLISSNSINGAFKIKLNGMKVINQQDYIATYKDLNKIPTEDFLEYMNLKKRKVGIENITYRIGSIQDDSFYYEGETVAPIIINESFSNEQLNTQNIDSDLNINYESIPRQLDFTVIADIRYNINEVIRKVRVVSYLVTNETLELKKKGNGAWTIFLNDLLRFFDNPADWAMKNAWWLFIVIIVIVSISVAWNNFQGGGFNLHLGNSAIGEKIGIARYRRR